MAGTLLMDIAAQDGGADYPEAVAKEQRGPEQVANQQGTCPAILPSGRADLEISQAT